MPYRILCNGVKRESFKASPDLASEHFCYVALHKFRYGIDRRSINGLIGLRVPHAVILEKCDRYKKNGKPVHRAELLNESDFTIISTYQLE